MRRLAGGPHSAASLEPTAMAMREFSPFLPPRQYYLHFGYKIICLHRIDYAPASADEDPGVTLHDKQYAPAQDPTPDAQAECDIVQAEFRATKGRRPLRRDPPPLPPALVPTDDKLRLRLAEELEYARRMLNVMGDELSSDGLIVARHIVAMQSIDIVGQIIGHIADVVRSSDPDGAVGRIGMGELKARLTRRSIA